MTSRYTQFSTPIGPMLAVATDDFLTRLDFLDAKYVPEISSDWARDAHDALLLRATTQLEEYFAGERTRFELPVGAEGTDYQHRVWGQIARVPFGKTITYAELARRVSETSSPRAAGTATGRNPIAVVVPCHRIVGTNGSLTGYAGGLPRKARLLALEGVLLEV